MLLAGQATGRTCYLPDVLMVGRANGRTCYWPDMLLAGRATGRTCYWPDVLMAGRANGRPLTAVTCLSDIFGEQSCNGSEFSQIVSVVRRVGKICEKRLLA
jgi:hypothetical protein